MWVYGDDSSLSLLLVRLLLFVRLLPLPLPLVLLLLLLLVRLRLLPLSLLLVFVLLFLFMIVLLLLFSLDCTCRGGARGGGRLVRRGRLGGGGRLVGEGRLVRGGKLVSLSEAANLLEVGLSCTEVGRLLGSGGEDHTVKAGARSLPSRQSPSRAGSGCAIKVNTVKTYSVSRHQGDSVSYDQGSFGFVRTGAHDAGCRSDLFAPLPAGRTSLHSLHALQAGQIWVRSCLAVR